MLGTVSGLTTRRNELPASGSQIGSSLINVFDHSRIDQEGEVRLRPEATQTEASGSGKVSQIKPEF